MKEKSISFYRTIFLSVFLFGVFFFSQVAKAENIAPPGQTDISSIIIKLKADVTPEQKAELIARNGGVEVSGIPALRMYVIEIPSSEVENALLMYKADPLVESAELNLKRKVEAIPSDLYYTTEQWALTKIGWESVFGSYTPQGTSKVAVLDTGVDASHPEIQGRILDGMSVFDDSKGLTDPHGHGTWLAGIIAANTDNSDGIAGVAFSGVNIIPVKVISNDGTGLDSNIIQGIIWAADNGADVILMGFSNPEKSSLLQDAIDYAWAKGAVLVASAGNDGQNVATFPAGHRGVIGVSATDHEDNLAPFSNYGDSIFLAAPGTEIASTTLGNDYLVISGTSPSAAIVAGVAAFMKAVDPTLTNGIIVNRLARTADPAGIIGQTGNGRINMARALEDRSMEEIQPVGVDAGGGPIVGPYRVAARNWNLYFAGTGSGSVTISVSAGTITAPTSCGGTGTATTSQTVTSTCLPNITTSENNAIVTFSASADTGSTFAGWSGQNNLSSSTCSDTTNPCSAVIGANATITVTFNKSTCTAPSISIHPQSQTKTVGESVTFSVTASGTTPLSYQWRKGGINITGATGSSYTISSLVVADAGSYDVVVSNDCGTVTSNAATLTVNKANQTITVTTHAPSTAAYNSTFNVAATASSGLSVSITTSGVCTGSGTGSATITMTSGTGTCTVRYNQAGNENYNPATEVTENTTAQKANQATLTLNATSPQTYNTTQTLSVTGGSGTGAVTYSVTSGPCSISGDQLTANSGTGSCDVKATKAADENYNEATASTTIQLQKANQTITFGVLSNKTYGDAPFTVSATASSGLDVSFSSLTTGTCTVSGNTVTIVAAGTCTIRASQPGNDNYNAAADVNQSFTINKADTTTTITCDAGPFVYNGLPHTPCTAVVTGPGGLNQALTVTYTNNINAGTATASATYAGDANYNGSSDTKNFTIEKANATCTISGWSGSYDGNPHGATGSCIGVMGETLSGLDLGQSFINVPGGTAYWTFTDVTGNYNNQSGSVEILITARPITITADAKTKVYGDSDPVLTYQITSGSLVNGDTITGSLSRVFGENVGAYAILQGTLSAGPNYSITFVSANLTITPRQITVTADNKTKVFGSPDPVFTFTVGGSGLASWDTVSTVFSGSLTRDSGENVGNYTIKQGTLTANSNYSITSFTNGTLTITPASTSSTVTVTPDSQQYSDKVTFTATLSPSSINNQSPATSVTFYVGTQNMGSCNLSESSGVLTCTLSDVALLENPNGNGQMAPGNRTVTAKFGGVNPNFSVNDATTTLTITQEDALAYYTGDTFVSTGSSTSSTATVLLSATIKDISAEGSSDTNPGDIRNATVTFVIRNSSSDTPIPGCTDLPVGLVSSDTKVGVASCNWNANIGSSSSETYTIGIIVNNYYKRDSSDDDLIVTVSKSLNNFITGGGYIINNNSAGICPGGSGKKTNFGFNVKYNKSLTNLQGNMNIIVRSDESCTPGFTGPRVYQIKANAIQNLTVKSTDRIATFTSKANIQDVTDPYNPIPLGGNGTLRVTMKDNGEPGNFDEIGITFYKSDGGLWFSSNWDGSKTINQRIDGGNLVVR